MTNNNTKANNMTQQQIIDKARKAGVSNHILHVAIWADELIINGNKVTCRYNNPNECDVSFEIPAK
jgi:hypothetical protein